MDKFDAIHIFSRAAQRLSFSKTADDLGITKAKVSNAIQQLERELGTRLFHRTTRRVQLTQDGMAYLEGCQHIIAELTSLESQLQTNTGISGKIKVDMSLGLAKHLVIPHLPEFLHAHPNIAVELSCVDYRVDIIREGFDCVLRVGTLADSNLIARPLGQMHIINCASPDYIRRYGVPETLDDMAYHQLIGYGSAVEGKVNDWEYWDGQQYRTLSMNCALIVNNVEAYSYACLAGMGIVQVPEVGARQYLKDGRLIQILQQYSPAPMPVSLIYPNRRNQSRKVQFFMDWLTEQVKGYLQ